MCVSVAVAADRPNIVLVMADDQGWGQVSYYGHPVLKTPNLDAMASAGLRFDRFYAAGPVCSPTRASVLTGRTHDRTGVPTHGSNLCLQEKTLPQALKRAGYTTGHFGKWHLNGVRGAGVPILDDDANHPGKYGFNEWLSVTNFFDVDPLMSRKGKFEEFKGDSSVIIVDEALKFIARQKDGDSPFLAVIWYGSPHNPMRAVDQDLKGFKEDKLGHHLGEIAGIDRSVGVLRKGLRDLGIERDTLFWYCSDNGGLNLDPDSVGKLRGHKGSIFEGGIRVPGIIEWPGHIEPSVTEFPASTMDIMPTIVDLLGLPEGSQLAVRDGTSLTALFKGDTPKREHSIPFRFLKNAALIDGDYKLLTTNHSKDDEWKLYNLKGAPSETKDLAKALPKRFDKMKAEAKAMIESVDASAAGKDYPEGKVLQPPRRAFWYEMPAYRSHLPTFFKRPEYSGYQKRVKRTPKRKSK
ncbi:MAG: N-acetylgalactosamine 6-sulfate sulfatase [Planctomycetaceae bacterium]|nr:N-acetylgalactosamine 6-sulfate sulfatase [Planctomycetaceae bacterium]